MSKLPSITGKECIKALSKAGFSLIRQSGSHVILRREDPFAEVVVPNHKTLDKGTLRAIIRQAELDINEFIRLLDN